MGEPVNGWRPRVVKTIATTGDGIKALAEAISQHAEHTRKSIASEANSDKLRGEVLDSAKMYFADIKLKQIACSSEFKRLIARVQTRRMDPYTAARILVEGN
jgi:LAO/AO transport system kinase